jgi:hypothetical protein
MSAGFSSCTSHPSVGFGTWNNADFNGDGSPDFWRAYQANNDWRVALEDGTGASFDDEAIAVVGPPPYAPHGGVDTNSDGREEAFITVGAGAYTTLYALYTLVGDCDLTRVYDSGQPVVFSAGASAQHIDGVFCTDWNNDQVTDVVQYRGDLDQNGVWTISPSPTTIDPAGFIVPLWSGGPIQVPNPAPYSGFHC